MLVKRAFENHFFVTQKIIKAEKLYLKFSSAPDTSMQQMLQHPFSKSMPLYFAISQPPSQKHKMVNKHKNLESRHFYSCPLRQNYPSGSYPTSQGNYSLPPGIILFKIYPTAKRGESMKNNCQL